MSNAPSAPEPPTNQPAETVIYLNFYDEINDAKVRGLMGICAHLINTKKPDRLYFSFASHGGSTAAGTVLHTYLRGLPVKVTMHNTGVIDSIANTIFVAADERYAVPHSSFLFHGVNWTFGAGSRVNINQLNETISAIKAEETKIAQILCGSTKLTEEEVRQLFVQGETKDALYALDKGVIHAIKELEIPVGSEVFSIDQK